MIRIIDITVMNQTNVPPGQTSDENRIARLQYNSRESLQQFCVCSTKSSFVLRFILQRFINKKNLVFF